MDDSAFTEYLVTRSLSARSIQIYIGVVRRATEWFEANSLELTAAGPLDVSRYAATTPNTHATRSHIRAGLRWYWQSISFDGPVGAIRVPPQPDMVCRAVEDDEARALVKVSLGWYPEGTAVLVGMYLALRRQEIAVMEWRRFDSDAEWYTVTGKFDRTATLPVHPILRDELVVVGRESGWVFPGRGSRDHVTPTTVWTWVRKVCDQAGVRVISPHVLRHTALAIANDRTGDLRAVQTFARHVKPETTAGYTRTKRRRLREISDSLDYLQ